MNYSEMQFVRKMLKNAMNIYCQFANFLKMPGNVLVDMLMGLLLSLSISLSLSLSLSLSYENDVDNTPNHGLFLHTFITCTASRFLHVYRVCGSNLFWLAIE